LQLGGVGQADRQDAGVSGQEMASHRLRVLVADEEEDMRAMFSRVLGSLGYGCDLCANGAECLMKFARQPYDIVFLDLFIPGVDGEPVLRWLRSQCPSTQVIVTSVQDDDGVIRTVLAGGATAYIVKPFTAHEVEIVMRGIENRRTAAGLSTNAVTL
jgi:CheY-like chemotaxis protein